MTVTGNPEASTAQTASFGSRVPTVPLLLLLLVALGSLGFYAIGFVRESLQMDFAAYYTAGEAINRNLTPYRNHVDAEPPLWDGVARFTHSRFLYPPLAAYLFSPLARLSYPAAKALWTLLGLVSIGASLLGAAWIVGPKHITARGWTLVGIAVALFHPFLTHLERGQIDSLTLMILVVSFALMLKGRRPWHGLAAGLLLGPATLLKLHVGLILPFLVVRRRWRVTVGYAIGLALLVVLSMLVTPALSIDYVTNHLPRISLYGEAGEADMLLREEALDRLLMGVPEGLTQKGGQVYQREYFPFFANATLVRYVSPRLAQWGLEVSLSQLSVGIFAVMFGVAFLWQRFCRFNERGREPASELLYWLLVLQIILLSAPQTWVMNLVWLLPLFVVLAVELPRVRALVPALCMVVWLAGLALAGVPDAFLGTWGISGRHLYPWGWEWASQKYLVAQLLLLVSITLFLTDTVSKKEIT